MTYFNFNEPMSKKERLEYLEEKEHFSITTKHQRVPYASEVIKRIKREPRQENVSPLLQSFMDRSKSIGNVSNLTENEKSMRTHRVLSKEAKNARNDVLKRLGIER